MTSAGEISFADFHLAIKWLCDNSQLHGDQWLLNYATCATPVQEVYASKHSFKKLLLHKRGMPVLPENDVDVNDVMCDDRDPACLHQNLWCESVKYENVCQLDHHIVYSHSYSVPVLYFNVYSFGGELLTLQELWGIVSDAVKPDADSVDLWKVITQQEHPLLRRPYFHLHPCHTAELMTQLRDRCWSPVNYLLSWLSTVAPAVLLDLPLCYATEVTSCLDS